MSYEKVTYEILILIPILIHDSVTRGIILLFYCRTMKKMDRTAKLQRRIPGEDRVKHSNKLTILCINLKLECHIYTIILLKSVCHCSQVKSQFLLDYLGRYIKLFVSTVIPSSHGFASQFGLANF